MPCSFCPKFPKPPSRLPPSPARTNWGTSSCLLSRPGRFHDFYVSKTRGLSRGPLVLRVARASAGTRGLGQFSGSCRSDTCSFSLPSFSCGAPRSKSCNRSCPRAQQMSPTRLPTHAESPLASERCGSNSRSPSALAHAAPQDNDCDMIASLTTVARLTGCGAFFHVTDLPLWAAIAESHH